MNNDQLLKSCRYYKGEEQNPFIASDSDYALLWTLEKAWVSEAESGKTSVLLIEYCDNLRHDIPEWANDKVAPFSLKGLLYDRYTHFGGGVDGFKFFFKKFYPVK